MKKENTTLTNLIEMKLAVIMHHAGDHNQYLRKSIAGDACYSSHNSMEYKSKQMSEKRAELASLRPAEGSEVIDKKLANGVDVYNRMSDEMNELQERFDADQAVYKRFAGEEWKPWTNANKKAVSAVLSALDDILGEDTAPIQEAK
tara:strand:- start:31 stop:468 length:438 start_codon:yes stop_codon:yes gene_type:complete